MKVGTVLAGQADSAIPRLKRRLRQSACAFVFGSIALVALGPASPALAQMTAAQPTAALTSPQPSAAQPAGLAGGFVTRQTDPNAKMLVTADQLVYDNTRNEVIADGNVQIYYDAPCWKRDASSMTATPTGCVRKAASA